MKKEQKEKIVVAAQEFVGSADSSTAARCRVTYDAKVLVAPDVYWVQAWISVPQSVDRS